MADRPILFSGPMIRALLAGKKRQTRRVITNQPKRNEAGLWLWEGSISGGQVSTQTSEEHLNRYLLDHVRFRVGDRLWVRETWGVLYPEYFKEGDTSEPVFWRADHEQEIAEGCYFPKWRPSLFMPRRASRITLTVTDVRVQRLQDIGASDAISEGVESTPFWRPKDVEGRPFEEKWWDDYTFWNAYPHIAFQSLWDSLNAERGYGWAVNPWVVAVTFDVTKGNIDTGVEP